MILLRKAKNMCLTRAVFLFGMLLLLAVFIGCQPTSYVTVPAKLYVKPPGSDADYEKIDTYRTVGVGLKLLAFPVLMPSVTARVESALQEHHADRVTNLETDIYDFCVLGNIVSTPIIYTKCDLIRTREF